MEDTVHSARDPGADHVVTCVGLQPTGAGGAESREPPRSIAPNGTETSLAGRPELVPAVRGEPADFVEEELRYDSPVQVTTRIARADGLEAGGVSMPADSDLILLLGAANRDSSRFPLPDQFDPTRIGNKPLSFGAGAAHLPGQQPGSARSLRRFRSPGRPLPGHLSRRSSCPSRPAGPPRLPNPAGPAAHRVKALVSSSKGPITVRAGAPAYSSAASWPTSSRVTESMRCRMSSTVGSSP